MLKREAQWIASMLGELPRTALFPFVNIGSSSGRLREVDQPFIDQLIFAPLRRRGGPIHHVDGKAERGVDLTLDLALDSSWQRLRALQARCVLCSNVFEHVVDRELLAKRLLSLLEPGGYLLVTVPRRFPYHPDPIDTGFRPEPSALLELFPELRARRAEEISGGRLGDLVVGQGPRLAKKVVGLLATRVMRGVSGSAAASDVAPASPIGWLKHVVVPFRVSCALFVR
jgi:hypothetical protein